MKCRSCRSERITDILFLGNLPLPNKLLSKPDEAFKKYPLNLVWCVDCMLVQLSNTVPPEEMFLDYPYLTSYSPELVAQAKELVGKVVTSHSFQANPLVVELGSNDGYLLQFYKEHSFSVLGIDPSVRAAQEAQDIRNIPTRREFFTENMAIELGSIADVIHANNVLAHVPDPNDFVAGMARLLKVNGTAIVEVAYVKPMLDSGRFDQIYAEHVSYFSIASAEKLFLRHGLEVVRVDHISTHGGSLRFWLKHTGLHPNPPYPELWASEAATYKDFERKVSRAVVKLLDYLELKNKKGRTIMGYGAAGKATTLLNYCIVPVSWMPYVTDESPHKIGKWIPGTGIQIVSPELWLSRNPDVTLQLAWNFFESIKNKYPQYKGEWVDPYAV
jgi:SAM-dependent methyltransferase